MVDIRKSCELLRDNLKYAVSISRLNIMWHYMRPSTRRHLLALKESVWNCFALVFLTLHCQIYLAPRILLRKKSGARGQLHVFS